MIETGPTTEIAKKPRESQRPLYEKPRLERHGDLRSKVFGPSVGVGDSPQNRIP